MRKLKIIGVYGSHGTQVIDEETGIAIPNVKKVTWTHQAGSAPTCVIELVGVKLAATGDEITSIDSPSMYREYTTNGQ